MSVCCCVVKHLKGLCQLQVSSKQARSESHNKCLSESVELFLHSEEESMSLDSCVEQQILFRTKLLVLCQVTLNNTARMLDFTHLVNCKQNEQHPPLK